MLKNQSGEHSLINSFFFAFVTDHCCSNLEDYVNAFPPNRSGLIPVHSKMKERPSANYYNS